MPTPARHLAVQINQPHPPPATINHAAVIGVLIFALGAFLVWRGIWSFIKLRVWCHAAVSVQGTVLDNVPQPQTQKHTAWLPLVEFQAGNETVLSLLAAASSAQGWPLGSHLDVLYDPRDPHRTRLAGSVEPISRALVAGVVILAIYFAATL